MIKVALLNRGNQIIMEVSDNGKGIHKEDQERIFQKGVSIGKPDGSGLGLHDAKKTIEKMNGKVIPITLNNSLN